jgi:surface polysaccharide O-acyltransferase-like enzyme
MKILYLNPLRVLAITGVIMTHIFMTVCAYFTPVLSGKERHFCVIGRNLWHWCTPLFAMISGALLLNPKKEIGIKKLFTKYISKLLVALFFFGIIFSLAEKLITTNFNFNLDMLSCAIGDILQNKLRNHLWYLYVVIALYLITPAVKIFVKYSNIMILKYTLLILFIFTSIIPFINNLFGFSSGFYIPVNLIYCFYFLLGYYLYAFSISNKNNTRIYFLLILLYIFYVVLLPFKERAIDWRHSARLISLEPNSPIVIIAAVSLFCLAKNISRPLKTINILSPLCFGIFLIHPAFIYALYIFFDFTPKKYPLFIYLPGIFIFTALFSILFAWTFQKMRLMFRQVI